MTKYCHYFIYDCYIYFSYTFPTQQVPHIVIRQSRTKKAINYENISKGYRHTLIHTITFKNKYNFDFFSQDWWYGVKIFNMCITRRIWDWIQNVNEWNFATFLLLLKSKYIYISENFSWTRNQLSTWMFS